MKPTSFASPAGSPLLALGLSCHLLLLAWVLITLPVLAVAVLVPALLLCRNGSQLSRWQRLATTDARTGLLNSYGWQRRAATALGRPVRSERGDVGPAVMLIDLDNFKLINDRHGHLAGDAMLAGVGAAVAESVRATDVVGRFGGDEFVVALRDVSVAELVRVAERIQAAVGRLRTVDRSMGVTVSVGAAACPSEGVVSLRELVAAADSALYEAKTAGRDTMRLALVVTGGADANPVTGVGVGQASVSRAE